MELTSKTVAGHQRRVHTHKRTDIPLLNFNVLMSKEEKRWFRAKHSELVEIRTALEKAAFEGMFQVLGTDWRENYQQSLNAEIGSFERIAAHMLRKTIKGLCINTAHTFMCHDTFFHIALQKQAVFETMSGVRRKHPLVDVKALMHDVYLEHGDAIDRVRNRKVMDARTVAFICSTLSKSDSFRSTYNTYRGVYYGVAGSSSR